jgi:hypothetical protein
MHLKPLWQHTGGTAAKVGIVEKHRVLPGVSFELQHMDDAL